MSVEDLPILKSDKNFLLRKKVQAGKWFNNYSFHVLRLLENSHASTNFFSVWGGFKTKLYFVHPVLEITLRYCLKSSRHCGTAHPLVVCVDPVSVCHIRRKRVKIWCFIINYCNEPFGEFFLFLAQKSVFLSSTILKKNWKNR